MLKLKILVLVLVVAVVALASAPVPTTVGIVTSPESNPGLSFVDPDCLLQGPSTSHTGAESNWPQLDLAQTTSSTSGSQTPPEGKPNCDGCTVDWGVSVTWAHTGSAATQFGGTTSPFNVQAGETTGLYTTDPPLQVACDDDEEFTAHKTETGNTASTTAKYACLKCQ